MASYSSYSNPESLTELSTIIERTLIDTGRLFRKSGSMPSRTHLQRSLPLYHDSFQNALDNLSEQIFIAKAFLERDYEALKATSATPQPVKDAEMSGVSHPVKLENQPTPAEPVQMDTELDPVPKSEEAVPASLPTPTQVKPEAKSGEDVEVKNVSNNNAAPDQSFPGTHEDLTFDSVLNDAGGTNDFGLSLDFNDDDMGNQAFLSGSNFTAAGTSGGADKPNTAQPTTNTAVPAGGDAFDMELGKAEGDDGTFPGQSTQGEDFMGPAESNFDDLFMDTDNFGENGGDFNQLEGDTLMNVNELDDNWFN
ncbi:uncharacterized protein N7515_006745 [Penicillium bovifimosum]|uniref:Uncharacterized protein n=1 Tax=Penicillium bovifimosum TaxID=126998 RepID=A0A9W9GWL9_9EURO|nr:uncharacterized protein N7515_006745 [Penicillium bovifimosum]KAJ5130706.1 hypothetical protein N7515_006745 [Penicillium bovifimosum]